MKPDRRQQFFVSVLFALLSLPTGAADNSTAAPKQEPAYVNPWAFNLTLYMWLAGANGDFSAGPVSRSVDGNFIDIVDKSHRFPLGFMGRLEAHYDRWGVYLDGTYMDLELKPKLEQVSKGLDTQLSVMDYGVAYRIFGPSAGLNCMPAAARSGWTIPST